VHENTVRSHIAALETGGVIVSERRPLDRPGRPGVNYRLADETLLAPSALAQLLGAALARAGASSDELRRTGRDWGRYLSGRPGRHDIAIKLPEVLAQLGFSCEVTSDRVELRNCPCKALVPQQPALIAALADGIVEGVLEACESDRGVSAAAHDPEARRCRFQLTELADKAPRLAPG
jgi:predicted ArsR family transcriptional regulator